MAGFDDRLCNEKHEGVNSSLTKLWTFFACLMLGVSGWLSYNTVHTFANEASVVELQTKNNETNKKFDEILGILKTIQSQHP